MTKRDQQMVVPDDIGHALQVRQETQEAARRVAEQGPHVQALVAGLRARGQRNHFAELLQFYARGGRQG